MSRVRWCMTCSGAAPNRVPMWCTDASRTKPHFNCIRQASSTTDWCRRSWPAWRVTWTCSCWTGKADGRRPHGLAVLADQLLELLFEIAQDALVPLGFLVRQKADGHPLHHVAAEIEAEKKLLSFAL